MQETLEIDLTIKVPKNVFINNWINEKDIYPLGQNHPKIINFKEKYNLG
ncbi:MAG: hypothetical protein ACLT69_13150 [Intestinibacter bartlettii]